MNEKNQIVLYEGSPLERIVSTALVKQNAELVKASRFFLGSDIFMSAYGIKGFLLMDSRPEDRWVSYSDGEWIGVKYNEKIVSLEYGRLNEPERSIKLAHFLDTKNGFKLVRYFILPENVYQLFANQRFLGEPMIRQLAMPTLPDEFDEVETDFRHAFVFAYYGNSPEDKKQFEHDYESLVSLITGTHPDVKDYESYRSPIENWGAKGHKAFVSFHPWIFYDAVKQTGETSIVQALANFDKFLSSGKVRHELPRKELPTENTTLYLPSRKS